MTAKERLGQMRDRLSDYDKGRFDALILVSTQLGEPPTDTTAESKHLLRLCGGALATSALGLLGLSEAGMRALVAQMEAEEGPLKGEWWAPKAEG